MGPTGFIVYAEDFLSAFYSFTSEKPFSPAKYYLVCRSIELAFKSFLSLNKIPIREIRYALGHDLMKILSKVKDVDINKVVEISDREETEIKKANNWYSRKGFEYFAIKNILESKETLPNLDILQLLAARLIKILKPLCLSST